MQMKKDEFTYFMNFKQDQYSERRENVRKMCQNIKNSDVRDELYNPKNMSLIYDQEHNLAYCQIPKVG